MIKEQINARMLEEVLMGMSQEQKSLPSKYFYDKKGSELFDRITDLKEYYPTRTEVQILMENIDSFHEYLGDHIVLIEPGSGSSTKTRILLDRLVGIEAYVPIDISSEYLHKVAKDLQDEYPEIEIRPLSADYIHPFDLPEDLPPGRPIVFFPGSTIGNFSPETVREFLEVVYDLIGKEGGFLIGVDLKKDREILLAAYNDSEGVTAEFNKNILRHINRLLGTDFKPDSYEHEAIWNEEESRIEMHLISKTDQQVCVNDRRYTIRKGESIHTENSHKYSLQQFKKMVEPWFGVKKVWTDDEQLFSIQYLEPRS
ncbi:L-histidine N(alpha)-methyltransferase [Balneola sp. MJW-20]|uniref:L-histidine N(alpha)-methyltransferase n=1 Tax=Gracilimonas aurantiaca TaxID=3234185 RepID=UPI003465E287